MKLANSLQHRTTNSFLITIFRYGLQPYLRVAVTEQRVTAQWSYAISDPDFCDHHWFGYALLSFTAGMHGGYFWRIKKAHRVWGRRRGIMDRGGVAIMIWDDWECMAAEELAIQRLRGKFWSGGFLGLEGENYRGGPSEESLLWRRTKADCARGFQKCVDRGVDLFVGRRLD